MLIHSSYLKALLSSLTVVDGTGQHGSNSPVDLPEIINVGWIVIKKKIRKSHLSLKLSDNIPDVGMEAQAAKASFDIEWPQLPSVKSPEAELSTPLNPEIITDAPISVPIKSDSEPNAQLDVKSIGETVDDTSAGVTDSDMSLSDQSDIKPTSVIDEESKAAKVEDNTKPNNQKRIINNVEENTIPNDQNPPIHSMFLLEYTGGFFKDTDTLHLTPGQQVLPECKFQYLPTDKDAAHYTSHQNYVCVATGSRRGEIQNQITPNAGTDTQNQEVDEPTVEETVEEPEGGHVPVNDHPPNIEPAEARGPPIQRELLITPTNPSIGINENMDDSIATTESKPIATGVLTGEQVVHKHVVLEYMSTILGVPMEDNLPFERYAKIYDQIPVEEKEKFTYEFRHGKGTFHIIHREPTHLRPLPLPPLPPAAFVPPPPRAMQTPPLPVATNQESPPRMKNITQEYSLQQTSGNIPQSKSRTHENINQSEDSEDERSITVDVRNCYTNSGSTPSDSESDKVLHAI
jgi:hypothetical protein